MYWMGKSMVYFLTTKLLREQGAGDLVNLSPAFVDAYNQLDAAQRIGVRARTINSTNNEEWQKIKSELAANTVDGT